MNNTILSIIRHALTFVGGLLVTKGLISDGTANEVARDENRMAQAGQSAPVPDDEDEEN